jgi:hypothetical protein
MSVAFNGDSFERIIGVTLMGYAKLMLADDFLFRLLYPPAGPNEVLCPDGGIPEEMGI